MKQFIHWSKGYSYEKKSIKKETFTQTTLFELNEEEITPKKNEIEEKIKNINPLEMTPMDALSFLYEINKETKNKKNQKMTI